MRLALLSDIHGNLCALRAVIADLEVVQPDIVLCGGDLATHGHRPAEVIDLVRKMGWTTIAGNTDECLWAPERYDELERNMPAKAGLRRILFHEFAPRTRELVGPDRIQWLRTLPLRHQCQHVTLVHASPDDLWDAPAANASDDAFHVVYGSLPGRIAVYGHIHVPFIRTVRGKIVANTGSVGLPFDGDPRASYLLIEEDWLTTRRVKYDVDSEVAGLLASGYPRAEWLAASLRTGQFTPPA
ncbi:MAG: metallophosphoesterase family protein [Bryobacteraceae bacterium]